LLAFKITQSFDFTNLRIFGKRKEKKKYEHKLHANFTGTPFELMPITVYKQQTAAIITRLLVYPKTIKVL